MSPAVNRVMDLNLASVDLRRLIALLAAYENRVDEEEDFTFLMCSSNGILFLEINGRPFTLNKDYSLEPTLTPA